MMDFASMVMGNQTDEKREPQPNKGGFSFADQVLPSENTQETPMSWGEAARSSIGNIPSSALGVGKGLVQAALNPIDTMQVLVKAAAGGMEKAFPGSAGLPSGNIEQYEAFKQYAKDRAGSEEALKRTLATDPVGLAADIAGLFAGAGGAVRAGGAMANMPKVARAGAAIAKAGGLMDPLNVARQAVTAPIRMIPDGLPQRLWASAVKPNSSKFPSQEAQAALFNTALENNIPLDIGGKERLNGLMRGVNDDISNIVNTGAARGDTIDPFAVAARVDELRPYYENQAVPSQFTGKLDDMQIGFVNEHPSPIPVDRAQQMKRAIYRENSKKYDAQLRNASDEAEIAIARGIKEELATLYPELNGLNDKFSKYIDLDGAITDALQRLGKHQVFAFTTPMWAQTGGSLGGPVGATGAAITKAVLDSSAVKSRLALSLAAAKRYPELTTRGGKTPFGAVLNNPEARALATNAQRAEEYRKEQ